MPLEIIRLYKGKDVDMLTALSTILTNAQANQPTLQQKRTNLTVAYLKDLETRLNTIIKDNLGVDNAKQLRQQTATVYGIEKPAYTALSVMKKQIESSFSNNKPRLKELLTELGYNSFFKGAQNKDTEAVINLLYQYQENMTPALQEELTASGIPTEDITQPLAYAETLRTANVSQESFKGTKKVATADVVQAFNDIYLEIISKISKLAAVFFPGSKPQQQLLSYTHIIKTMNNTGSNDKTTTPPVP